MKYADLHVHTLYSDGTFTPEEVVDTAKRKGLSCISICDHDCTDAIEPAIHYAKDKDLEIIPGVELTVIRDQKEIHVLGYFIQWKEAWFQDVLRDIQKGRVARIEKMIEKFKKLNIIIDKEKVMEKAGGKGSVGRLHMAHTLLDMKVISNIKEAFEKYIGDFKPCFVEDVGFTAEDAIALILKAKGVPVLAHPGTISDDNMVQEFIKLGVSGFEIYHTDQTSSESEKYKKMAEDNDLIVTGGSDCHGVWKKGGTLMGRVKVPYTEVEKLKEKARVIQEG